MEPLTELNQQLDVIMFTVAVESDVAAEITWDHRVRGRPNCRRRAGGATRIAADLRPVSGHWQTPKLNMRSVLPDMTKRRAQLHLSPGRQAKFCREIMSVGRLRSFAEVTILEAVARRVRADLVLKPVRPKTDRRLLSRFLGTRNEAGLVLATPQTPKGEKVLIPVGWSLGLSFELAGMWVQACTSVLERCLFSVYPTRRVDGLVVQWPEEVLTANRRRRPRLEVDPSRPFAVTLWQVEDLNRGNFAPLQEGQLTNWSDGGLGIKLARALDLDLGTRLAIRLQRGKTGECLMVWGVLKHCSIDAAGSWVAGFGDVVDIAPGEAVELIESLAGLPAGPHAGKASPGARRQAAGCESCVVARATHTAR